MNIKEQLRKAGEEIRATKANARPVEVDPYTLMPVKKENQT